MGVMDSNGEMDQAVDSILILPKPILGTMVDPRDDREYQTVNIDGYWWMAENLKYGSLIPIDSAQTDNGIVEMYAYENNPEMFENYGGLYSWSESMQYDEDEGAQGVCPPEWHVPTWGEWKYISKGIATITLVAYYGEDGPGGLKLDFGGYIQRYYQSLERPIERNISLQLNKSGSFWTSSHEERLWKNFQGQTATQRQNRNIAISKIDDYPHNNNYITGFRSGGDRIHLHGNVEVYSMGSGSIINAWFANYVRCIKN